MCRSGRPRARVGQDREAWVRPSELKREAEFATQIEQTANLEITTDLDFDSWGERFCLLNEYWVAIGISSVLHELVELLRHVAGIHQQEQGAIQAHFRNEIAGGTCQIDAPPESSGLRGVGLIWAVKSTAPAIVPRSDTLAVTEPWTLSSWRQPRLSTP